ncbi:hypothetical protein [Streptomyces cadmiisoli]|nr:hypothetical protein [Streptomyces cadmiisoli]
MTEEYEEAYKVLYDHVLTCPDCPDFCLEGSVLRRAVREAR